MRSTERPIAGPRSQAGVGLIEVLISLLVLSIGMLGLAGLQLWSLRNNQGAMERSMAVVETHSIVDAMRADRAAAIAGHFDADTAGLEDLSGGTFAERSLATWHTNLVKTLGAGASGVVDCTNTAVNEALCTITVRWRDDRPASSGTARREPAPSQEVITKVQL